MTRPTHEAVALAISGWPSPPKAYHGPATRDRWDGHLKQAARVLSLLPEGRSEQPDIAEIAGDLQLDLSAARLRIKALEEREQELVEAINDALESVVEITHPKLRKEGGLGLAVAPHLLQKLEDLALTSAQGETKPEGFSGARHVYDPDPKHPWFCGHCGYAEHERLQHIQPGPAAPDAAALVGAE